MPLAPVPVRPDAIRAWLGRVLDATVEVEIGTRTGLPGALASASVERVEVVALYRDGRREAHPVVAKRASEVEELALRQLSEVPDAATFPELVDAGVDHDGPWVVLPYYDGRPLAWSDPLPPSVLADLARLHAYGRDRSGDLPATVRRMDATFVAESLLEFAPGWLRQAGRQWGEPAVFEPAIAMFRQWVDEGLLTSALPLLDCSMVHGDTYGLNVLRLEGRHDEQVGDPPNTGYRLIDWGNLRFGPVLFDVLISLGDVELADSPGFTAYLDAWNRATGEPFDPFRLRLGITWARTFVNASYCGAVAGRFSRDDGEAMLHNAERGYRELATLL